MKTGRVTIPQIAKATGYSMMAVSYALGDKPGVSDETREKIKAKAAEMGYAKDLAARGMRNTQSGLIVLLCPKLLPDLTVWVAALQETDLVPVILIDDERTKERVIGLRAEAVIRFPGTENPSVLVPVIPGRFSREAIPKLFEKLRC